MKCEPGQCVIVDTSCGTECVVCGWGWMIPERSPREKIIIEHGNETFYIDPDTGTVVRGSYTVERTEIQPPD